MTRIFTDGAEMADILFFTATVNDVHIGTSNPFISPYFYEMTGYAYKDFSPISECYTRLRIKCTSPAAFEWTMPAFYYDTTPLAMLGIDYQSHWNALIYTGGWASVQDSGVLLSSSQWYLVEIYFKMADSPDGRFVVYVDGIKIIDFTGDTKGQTPSTFNRIQYYRGNNGGWYYFDDLALNDTSNSDGKNDNSWCGDGVILKIYPSGSSATTNNWLNSGSTSGSSNYTYVDEYGNDGDTTYVYTSGSNTGVQDQYAMSDLSLGNKQILRIWTEGRAKKTVADSTIAKIGFLASGGTDTMSGSQALGLSYGRIFGEEAKINPVTSASWTNADLNALEAVIEVG